MRSVSLRLVDLERKPLIPLGFEGENEYMTINFDCKTVFDKHPVAVPTLAVTPPHGDSYPAVVVRDGDIVSWTVTDSDLVYPGEGELQLTFVDGTIIGKTYKARTKVLDSITPSGEAPTPVQNWLVQAAAALQALPTEVASSVVALMGSMVGVGETLDPDDDVTVNYDPDNNTLTIGVPHGRDGVDGHTPAIAAEKVGKVATFYVDGVAIVQISDGQDADPTALIDDTSTAQNRTWSAKKLDEEKQSLKTQINSKPDMAETAEDDADLYVSDSDGNVLVQFSGGHIQTKNFNSENATESVFTDANDAFDIVDGRGNSVARFQNGHIHTKNFNSEDHNLFGTEYLVSDGTVMLAYGYTDTHDAVIVMNSGRANGLFDFSALMLKPKGKLLKDCTSADFTYVWSSSTDMHSPFQFLAVNNPDGYYSSATDPTYTGGNHLVEINGTNVQTASSKYVYFFADGSPVTSGSGRCVKFEIRWANNVQAYNCVKADGTGRTSMIEYHDMVFDGIQFVEDVMLVPTEDIKMQFWEGFAFVSWGTKYDHIRFIDATNRGIFTYSDSNVKSGNAKTSGLIAWGDDHAVEMHVDTNVDLGKRDFYVYGQDSGAFASASSTKGYFQIIYKYSPHVEMAEGEGYLLRGSFRFYPVVNE